MFYATSGASEHNMVTRMGSGHLMTLYRHRYGVLIKVNMITYCMVVRYSQLSMSLIYRTPIARATSDSRLTRVSDGAPPAPAEPSLKYEPSGDNLLSQQPPAAPLQRAWISGTRPTDRYHAWAARDSRGGS